MNDVSRDFMVFIHGVSADCGDLSHIPELNQVSRIAGGKRLLRLVPETVSAQRIVLDANTVTTLRDTFARLRDKEKMLILASGDPLFFGIAETVSQMLPRKNYRISAAPAAFQCAFARIGRSWRNYSFFSVHGSDAVLPCALILRAEGAVIYGDGNRHAVIIAREILAAFPQAEHRHAAVFADLGLPSETVFQGSLREIADLSDFSSGLSMLILTDSPKNDGFSPSLPLGLPDQAYLHENNMITHPETRAVVLSKLRLRRGALWDLGAGSGSVGIEAAGLCPTLQVYAVEKNELRCSHIRQNAAAHGVVNFHLMTEDMTDFIRHFEEAHEIPAPDSVFFGGGGNALKDLIPKVLQILKPGGVIAASAVLWETEQILYNIPLPEGVSREFVTLNIARTEPIGARQNAHIRRAENPVLIAVFTKHLDFQQER